MHVPATEIDQYTIVANVPDYLVHTRLEDFTLCFSTVVIRGLGDCLEQLEAFLVP